VNQSIHEDADYAFSEDETTLYTLANHTSFELSLIQYSFPSLEILEIIPLRFDPLKLFLDNRKIYIVGQEFQTEETHIQSIEH